MFGNFVKLDSRRRLVQFRQNFQTPLVLLIPNCTRHRKITYTYKISREKRREEADLLLTDMYYRCFTVYNTACVHACTCTSLVEHLAPSSSIYV